MIKLIAAVAVTATMLVAAPARADVSVVTPSALGIWHPALLDANGAALDGTDGFVGFVAGPLGQPAGLGSARLLTASGHGDGSAQLYSTAFAGTPLRAITALTYSTYVTRTDGAQLPYLRLTLDVDGDNAADDQIIFEPAYQRAARLGALQPPPAAGTWQTWDARAGGWWALGGLAGAGPGDAVRTLAEIVAAAPGARIVNASSRNGGVSVSSGVVSPAARFDGNVDALTIDVGRGPTTYDFEPGPPPPVNGVSATIRTVEGTVIIRPPGKRTRRLAAAGENVPVGTLVDATRGKAAVTTAVGTRGKKTQTSLFYAGAFSIRQRRGSRPLTDISLRAPRFAVLCGRPTSGAKAAGGLLAQSAATRRKKRKRVVARLWGNGKGSFRTKGRNSAATVSGTRWLTQERCDGTLTFVKRGVVSVRDLRTGKVVRVHAGHSYLAHSG